MAAETTNAIATHTAAVQLPELYVWYPSLHEADPQSAGLLPVQAAQEPFLTESLPLNSTLDAQAVHVTSCPWYEAVSCPSSAVHVPVAAPPLAK